MKQALTILCLLLTNILFAQSLKYTPRAVSSKVIKHINQLKHKGTFDYESTGFFGGKSETYLIFEKAFQIATIAEWRVLCNHPTPLIRYYAFYALKKHKIPSNKLIPIALNHLNDTDEVMAYYGCIGESEMVGDFMFKSIEKHYQDSLKLKHHIDRLFFYKKGPLITRANEYLKSLPKTEELRARLQDMVQFENNQYAFNLLLSYNNPEDSKYAQYILDKYPKLGLNGIMKFPETKFLKDLKRLKTQTNKPYKDWDLDIMITQNPEIIFLVYKAYLHYPPSIRNKEIIEVFNSDYSTDFKWAHAMAIYKLLKDNHEEWTKPIKLTILPYLSKCDKEYIDQLATLYPDKTAEIFKNITTRHKPYMRYNSTCSQAIINQLLKNTNRDSIEFLRIELQKDLTPLFFSKYYTTLTTLTHRKEVEILIHRLKQKLKTEKVELSGYYIDFLTSISNQEIRKEIWWICYHHIQKNNGTPIKDLLKVMDIYNPKQTQILAQDLFLKQHLKFYANWDAFTYLHRKNKPELNKWLIRIYNQMPYSFKTSRLGRYMEEELFPSEDW